jgi:transmembrane sensor
MPADLRTQRRIQDEAIGWLIRLRDADEQGWQAFTSWLEADPAHAAAYDVAALADAEADLVRPRRPTLRDPQLEQAEEPSEPKRVSRRGMMGWAAAATILLSGSYLALSGPDSTYSVETRAGERQVVALGDGSRIELNGSSRVQLDRERPRYARLSRGEALFDVVHDARRPFEVEAGGTLLRDMGTVFNVVAEKNRLEVAVSEGVVLYDPAGAAERLTPGLSLRKHGEMPAEVARVPAESVGGWRQGRLIYTAAPVAQVAADLSRNLGVPVAAESSIEAQPFSGVILLNGERREVLDRSATILGLSLQRSGETWLLTRAGAEG